MRDKKNKDELLLEVLALKEDQEFMDLINSVTFTYSSKYKNYNKPKVETNDDDMVFDNF